MAILDHWHPVLPIAKLGRKPQRIRLAGRDIVLFRDSTGSIGALDDVCVHRRASLAKGCVVNGRLQCGYHGWTYDVQGRAESPGTPKLRCMTQSYDTQTRYGFIWIKNVQVPAALPEFDLEGYEFVCARSYDINAPLAVVLDNFTEVEHTPTTHANFGYDLSRMSEVTTTVEHTPEVVRVVNCGPQKKTPWIIQQLAGLKTGDVFTDDWTTYFSPVYSCYDQFWNDPKTGAERRDRYRIYVFFNPLDEERTQLIVFAYLRARTAARSLFIKLTRPALSLIVHVEIVCDVKMLESLADKNPDIEGMKLSRFDRVLGLNRDRIERIYRGTGDPTPVESSV